VTSETLLLTGASSDIGVALIRELAHPGNSGLSFPGGILVHAHSATDRLEALVSEFPQLAPRLKVLPADLAAPEGAQNLIARVRSECEYPTHVVHLAAARPKLTRVTKFAWPALARDLDIQLRSLIELVNAFGPAMLRSKRNCKIVVMLSSVTLTGSTRSMPEYVVAKHALLGYFRALSAEFAGKAVTVNALSPSMVDTQFLADVPRLLVEQTAAASPHKRNALATDVTPVIRFLLSADSNYLHGVNLAVTAGNSA
jgi:3-oxoacyl-[acyl-carrier protein] reductase